MAAVKIGELNTAFVAFADALHANKADRCAVRSLLDFCAAFVGHEELTVASFLKAVARCAPQDVGSSSGPSIASLRNVLASLRPMLAGLKRKDLNKSVDSLLDALPTTSDVPVPIFVLAVRRQIVSASRPTGKKGARPMNETIVDDYVRRLEAALGNEREFQPLLDELRANEFVSQAEAVAIASRFYGQTSSGTTRARALARIKERHDKMMDFKRQPSTAGRSAA